MTILSPIFFDGNKENMFWRKNIKNTNVVYDHENQAKRLLPNMRTLPLTHTESFILILKGVSVFFTKKL